ncbi:glycerophosphodiester phosphodiesterase family protein [Streptomyces sp. NPDC048295]|uniref:glycerophosphodiester phosphodiesterase n=1 Tax=Streptomyces sp. NPDC048295 TaxID=3154617 RepID=UPI00341D592D
MFARTAVVGTATGDVRFSINGSARGTSAPAGSGLDVTDVIDGVEIGDRFTPDVQARRHRHWQDRRTSPHDLRKADVTTFNELPAVLYSAHRGGAGEAPENSLEALRSAVSWADVLDIDTQVLADGTPVLMHDATVDRTTARSGPVASFGLAQWLQLRADPATWFAAASPALTVPTVAQVLDDLGGARAMTVEAKDPAGVQALARLVLDRGLQESVLINTNDPAVVPLIRAAGCRAHLWRSAAQMAGDDFGAFVAAGADVLDIDIAASDALIAAAVAAAPPLGVWAHTLTRRVQRDRALALGCRGIVTDYPGYVSGRAPRRTATSTSTGFWGLGWVPSGKARPVLDSSGRIPLPAPTSSTDTQVLLAGEVSAAPANGTFEVRFSVPTAGASGWSLLSLHLGRDDAPTKMSSAEILHDGYTVQVSNNSSLRVYRDDAAAGTSTQLANTASGATLAAETVYTLRCAITATQLTVSVPEAGVSTTVTDKTHRAPWSVFVGRNHNASATGLIRIIGVTTS